jgi:hypothetical protein
MRFCRKYADIIQNKYNLLPVCLSAYFVAETMHWISIKFGIRWSDRTHLPYYDAPVLAGFRNGTSENNLCSYDNCRGVSDRQQSDSSNCGH